MDRTYLIHLPEDMDNGLRTVCSDVLSRMQDALNANGDTDVEYAALMHMTDAMAVLEHYVHEYTD